MRKVACVVSNSAGRDSSQQTLVGQNRYQWRKMRIGRTGILLHRVVCETALNEKFGGAGSIA